MTDDLLTQRATSWLATGGFFNPDHMAVANPDATRELVMDLRQAVIDEHTKREAAERARDEALERWDHWHTEALGLITARDAARAAIKQALAVLIDLGEPQRRARAGRAILILDEAIVLAGEKADMALRGLRDLNSVKCELDEARAAIKQALDSLRWAEKQLRALVTDDNYGVFVRGTCIELAGFGAGMKDIRDTIKTLAAANTGLQPGERNAENPQGPTLSGTPADVTRMGTR